MIKIIDSNSKNIFLRQLKSRNENNNSDAEKDVLKIIENVRRNGDEAVRKYTYEFDKAMLDCFEVGKYEIEEAFICTDEAIIASMKKSLENIISYHKKQLRETVKYKVEGKDIILGQIIRPIERAGIYVPGGKASYPSTVFMNAVPAKIAGVEDIIMITPPNKDGRIDDKVLVAAKLAGVDKIFKVGGAQGIAALAYGTQTIPRVDKITGPGNIYVTTAKKLVSGIVGIDMIAGPSEVLIIADEYANERYIAADLISQAEHDELAASVLLTDSIKLANKVKKELEIQVNSLSRKEIIKKSLENNGALIVLDSLIDCIKAANDIAPEHLEILTNNPFELYKDIKNAGAIFLGEYSPEPLGDYFAGPNHTLPTSQTARFSSALGVDDFIKKSSFIYYGREAFMECREDIIRLAEIEGLTGHANAIRIRTGGDSNENKNEG